MAEDNKKLKRGNIGKLIRQDAEVIQPIRRQKLERLDKVKTSSVEAQVAFLKELMKNKEAADEFTKDPKQYTVEHGILFSPEVVKTITDVVLYDTVLGEEKIKDFGDNALQDLIDMRAGKPMGAKSFPAAVAAGAAVVMAAAAVVTMVVTLVRMQRPGDLYSLSALGDKGIILPNGKQFISRDIQQVTNEIIH